LEGQEIMSSFWVAAVLLAQMDQPRMVNAQDYTSCAVSCYYAVACIHHVDVPFGKVRSDFGSPASDGTHSFADIARIAKTNDLFAIGLQTDWNGLQQLPLPAILQVSPQIPGQPAHLVVLLNIEKDVLTILDTPHKPFAISWSKFQSMWTGNVLTFVRNQQQVEYLQAQIVKSNWWHPVGLILLGFSVVSGIMYSSRRKYLLILLVATLLVLLVGLLIYSFWPSPAQFICPTPVMELGLLDEGEHLVNIPIYNSGQKTLFIDEVSSSCTCAITEAPQQIAGRSETIIKTKLSVKPGNGRAVLNIANNGISGLQQILLVWSCRGQPTLIPRKIISKHCLSDGSFEQVLFVNLPGNSSNNKIQAVNLISHPMSATVELAANAVVKNTIIDPLGLAKNENIILVRIPAPKMPQKIIGNLDFTLAFAERSFNLSLPYEVDFFARVRPEVGSILVSSKQSRSIRILDKRIDDKISIQDCPDWLSCKITRVVAQLCRSRTHPLIGFSVMPLGRS
jgi:hypothetical protein